MSMNPFSPDYKSQLPAATPSEKRRLANLAPGLVRKPSNGFDRIPLSLKNSEADRAKSALIRRPPQLAPRVRMSVTVEGSKK